MTEPPRRPPVSLTPAERSALHERTNGYQSGYDAGYGKGLTWGRFQGLVFGVALAGAAAIFRYLF